MKRLPVACHVPGCRAPIPRTRLMCVPHWKSISPELRRAVNRSYRAGQAFGWPMELIEAHRGACARAIRAARQATIAVPPES